MKELGKKLRQAREGLGLSQASIAEGLGRSQSWLSRLERGDRVYLPSEDDLRGLVYALDLSSAELLELAGYLEWSTRDLAYVLGVVDRLRRRGLRRVA